MKKLLSISIYVIFSGFMPEVDAQITPWEAIAQMQKGINLGNTLEPPNEAGWNNPKAQEYYFDLYKDAGFQCIRVPVRWDEHTGKTFPYAVDATWMNRVEEVMEWGLKRGFYMVLNAHHEEWIKSNYSTANKARFDSIWSQIAVRFKDKTEKLLLEIINEPKGLTKAQNDDLHLRILSIIRKTNPTRLVIFQGHEWGGSSELVVANIPNDNYLIGSFHSYDPYLFGLEGQGKWGNASDIAALVNKFSIVKNWSDKNNIPVFLGEFGAIKTCDYNSRMKHYKTYVELAQNFGFASCAWDDGGDFQIMLRSQKVWNEIKDILIFSSAKSPNNPTLQIYKDSIIRLSWSNVLTDNDSIFIERRTTSSSYRKIASLPGNATLFNDIKPLTGQYYHYRIIANYNSGKQPVYSHPVQIYFPAWTVPVRKPFPAFPHPIPGTIEAENFDAGGEDFTYHDNEPTNLPGFYRPLEGVDIYDRNGTGYHIGNVVPGEWYEYSVNVEPRGTYKLDVEIAATQGGGTFKISIGNAESDTLKALNSNSALITKSVSTTIKLDAGKQIMRFTVLGYPAFNIDKIRFDLITGTAAHEKGTEGGFIAYQNSERTAIIVAFKNNYEPEVLTVYDISGKRIYSQPKPGKTTTIPASGLKPGIYFVQTLVNKVQVTKKIILK